MQDPIVIYQDDSLGETVFYQIYELYGSVGRAFKLNFALFTLQEDYSLLTGP